jgi:hypothetical protein
MIGQELHHGESFWSFPISVDKDLAECARQQGCPCGGRLSRPWDSRRTKTNGP